MGDMVEKGSDGDRILEVLRERLVVCVRGNHDDNAVQRFHDGDEAEDDPLLNAESVAFLASLPREREYRWCGVRVVLSHIAPGGGNEAVSAGHVPKRLKRTLRGYEVDLVLLGHTHTPMKIRHGEVCFVNPGSVAGTRPRDSGTCAVVDLPSLDLEVLSLRDGAPVSFTCSAIEYSDSESVKLS